MPLHIYTLAVQYFGWLECMLAKNDMKNEILSPKKGKLK
jgi:hypothetical protein